MPISDPMYTLSTMPWTRLHTPSSHEVSEALSLVEHDGTGEDPINRLYGDAGDDAIDPCVMLMGPYHNGAMFTGFENEFLVDYDPCRAGVDYYGRATTAHLVTTPDPRKARVFRNLRRAWEAYRLSTGKPRTDGKPDRPLTAFTIILLLAEEVEQWPIPDENDMSPTYRRSTRPCMG